MPTVKVGDLSLFYQESGSGEPLVLVPGLGTDHTAWGHQVSALQGLFRCIAVDNRDAGRSDHARGLYTIREMAEDIVGLMDALDISSAHLVGWSMGGAIAQELALGWPERVRTLALVASYHESDPRGVDRFETAGQIRRELGFEAFLKFSYVTIFTHRAYLRPGYMEGMRKRAVEYPHQQSPEAYERQAHATVGHEAKGRLSLIQAPTLVLAGAEDILTPLERFSRPMAEVIPNARLTVLPEVGHALLWEQPEAVNAALKGFLLSVAE